MTSIRHSSTLPSFNTPLPADIYHEFLSYLPKTNDLAYFAAISSLSKGMYEMMKRVEMTLEMEYTLKQGKFLMHRMHVTHLSLDRYIVLHEITKLARKLNSTWKVREITLFLPFRDGRHSLLEILQETALFENVQEIRFECIKAIPVLPEKMASEEARSALSSCKFPNLQLFSMTGMAWPNASRDEMLTMALNAYLTSPQLRTLHLDNLASFPGDVLMSPSVKFLTVHLHTIDEWTSQDGSSSADVTMKGFYSLLSNAQNLHSLSIVMSYDTDRQAFNLNLHRVLQSCPNLHRLCIQTPDNRNKPFTELAHNNDENSLLSSNIKSLVLDGITVPFPEVLNHFQVDSIYNVVRYESILPLPASLKRLSLGVRDNFVFPASFWQMLLWKTDLTALDFPQTINLWDKMASCKDWHATMPHLKYVYSTYRDAVDVAHLLLRAPNARIVVNVNDLPRMRFDEIDTDIKRGSSAEVKEFTNDLHAAYREILSQIENEHGGNLNGKTLKHLFCEHIKNRDHSASSVSNRNIGAWGEFCIISVYQIKTEQLEFLESFKAYEREIMSMDAS